jgi:hypothetical protein
MKDKVRASGAESFAATKRRGNETLDRARSVPGKFSNGIAERTLRRRGDDEERDEEG